MLTVELGLPRFGLRPDHGMHEPRHGSPARMPESIRRTTSMDMTVDQAGSTLLLEGRGRDMVTLSEGVTRELAAPRLHAGVDLLGGAVLRSFASEPPEPRWSALVGHGAMGGLRGRADRAAPEHRASRSALYSLVDDVPVTTLISGHAVSASMTPGAEAGMGYLPVADQCAGFVTGGTMMASFDKGVIAVVTGPDAPDLHHVDDPMTWHDMPALPLHGMRRVRRVDVSFAPGGEVITVDAMFRDTYVRGDGVETVIHEYDVAAAADRRTGVIVESVATPRVLPWLECPQAVESAGRIVGMTVDELHDRVRGELRGTSTCTHLNDLLRSLGDVGRLADTLDHQLRTPR